ncbi:MAG: hypothetical protein MHM6MM_005057 [Cercozoa sp. M6MM]
MFRGSRAVLQVAQRRHETIRPLVLRGVKGRVMASKFRAEEELSPAMQTSLLDCADGEQRLHLRNLVMPRRKRKKQLGRGAGTDRGKTSGRGHKGAGKYGKMTPYRGYEGGQTPLFRRLRKWRKNEHKDYMSQPQLTNVPLYRLAQMVAEGRIDPNYAIHTGTLFRTGAAPQPARNGYRIVHDETCPTTARFDLSSLPPLDVQVASVSPEARAAIEAAGGRVKHVFLDATAMKATLHPHNVAVLPESNGTPKKKWRHMFPDYPTGQDVVPRLVSSMSEIADAAYDVGLDELGNPDPLGRNNGQKRIKKKERSTRGEKRRANNLRLLVSSLHMPEEAAN